MSEDTLEALKCLGKIGYDGPADAKRAALQMTRPGRNTRGPRPVPYRCVFCDKFHVGTNFPAARKKPKPQ